MLMNNCLSSGINWGQYILGFLLAGLMCVIAYLLVMTLYFHLKQKKPSSKFLVEIVFVIGAMILSVFIKFLVLPAVTDVNSADFGLGEYIGYSFSAIYSMVGGLQFEGLPFGVDAIGSGVSLCLYYGSSILAGLIVLSVITAKASYEIFSGIMLLMIRLLPIQRNVYIFNSLSEDSILLAQSIVEHHEKEVAEYKQNRSQKGENKAKHKGTKPKKALIIFSGDNIPSFSRSDSLCREIMSSSFYYLSLINGSDIQKALIYRLGLGKSNVALLTEQPAEKTVEEIAEKRAYEDEAELKTSDKLLKKSESEYKAKAPNMFAEKVAAQPTATITQGESNKKQKPPKDPTKKGRRTRICEFYFELDENKKPLQEQNTTDAFAELDKIVQDVFTPNLKLLNHSDAKWLTKLLQTYNNKVLPLNTKIESQNKISKKLSNQFIEDFSYEFLYRLSKTNKWIFVEHFILTLSNTNYEYYDFEIAKRVNTLLSTYMNLPLTKFFGKKDLQKIVELWAAGIPDFKLDVETATLSDLLSISRTNLSALNNKFKKTFQLFLSTLLQIKIVNEAYLTSISLLDERYNNIGASSIWQHLGNQTKEDKKVIYKALILGFGATGQYALDALYSGSSYISKDFKLGGFYADVFDQNIAELEGVFSKNHPLYKCYYAKDDAEITEGHSCYDSPLQKNNIISSDEIKEVYSDIISNDYTYEKLCDDMQFPVIQFHKKACMDLDFIDFFDKNTGSDIDGDKNKSVYNIIVISFGSDRTNISIANTIIDDIKREYMRTRTTNRSTFRQCIAVNIRDRANLNKLNWNRKDFELGLFNNLVVFPFGAKEDIYSYERIVDYSQMYRFNTNYTNMSEKVNAAYSLYDSNQDFVFRALKNDPDTIFKKVVLILKEQFGAEHFSCEEIFDKMYSDRHSKEFDFKNSMKQNMSYFALTSFKKETNRATAIYSHIMRRAFVEFSAKDDGEFVVDLKTVKAVLSLEHDRWSRFCIASGWIYNKTKHENLKMHQCILPMAYIKPSVYPYDLMNAVPHKYTIFNDVGEFFGDLISCKNSDDIRNKVNQFLSYKIKGEYEMFPKVEMFKTIKIDSNTTREIDVSPIIVKFPSQNTVPTQDILICTHYDVRKQVRGMGCTNCTYTLNSATSKTIFTANGGVDDLGGLASVLFGIVNAKKSFEKLGYNVTLLITGGEELKLVGSEMLLDEKVCDLSKQIKADCCLVFDINDKIGSYSLMGATLKRLYFGVNVAAFETKNSNGNKCIDEVDFDRFKSDFVEKCNDKKLSISFNELPVDAPIYKNIKKKCETMFGVGCVEDNLDDESELSCANIKVYYTEMHVENDETLCKNIKKINEIEPALVKFLDLNSATVLVKDFDDNNSKNQQLKQMLAKIENSISALGIKPQNKSAQNFMTDANNIKKRFADMPCILLSNAAQNPHDSGEFVELEDLNINAQIVVDILTPDN